MKPGDILICIENWPQTDRLTPKLFEPYTLNSEPVPGYITLKGFGLHNGREQAWSISSFASIHDPNACELWLESRRALQIATDILKPPTMWQRFKRLWKKCTRYQD